MFASTAFLIWFVVLSGIYISGIVVQRRKFKKTIKNLQDRFDALDQEHSVYLTQLYKNAKFKDVNTLDLSKVTNFSIMSMLNINFGDTVRIPIFYGTIWVEGDKYEYKKSFKNEDLFLLIVDMKKFIDEDTTEEV